MNFINTNEVVLTPVRDFSLQTQESDLVYKKGIWVFFILLIFEGGLRKWVLPGLSNALLIVRDPIVIWLLIVGIRRNFFPSTIYLKAIVFVGTISFLTAIFFGHQNFIIAAYGAKILLLYFPFIFIIGRIFTREDVIKMGKVFLFLSVPMALLTAMQFYSPQSAFVNRGVGGNEEGSGFSGALGYYRPSGTFAFTNGNAHLFSVIAAYLLYFWLNNKEINRLLLVAATIGLIAAIPLSISRTLFYSCCICVVFALIATLRKPKYLSVMLLVVAAGGAGFLLLGKASFFQTATAAFTERFEGASAWEGGALKGSLGNRYLGTMFSAFDANELATLPFFGHGIGASTNIAQTVAEPGTVLVYKEDEWQRSIMELGFLLGLIAILCRVGLTLKLALASYNKLKDGDLLPWMLLSFAAVTIPTGQWAQPSTLGFSILIGGLIVASFRRETAEMETT